MKRVTLTFDNGPTPGVTERVLEILERDGLRCTFFVIGEKVRGPAELALLQAAHQAGHWIGNHTLSHRVALGDRPSADHAVREIEGCQSRISAYSRPEKLFRPYGNSGLIGPHLLSEAAVGYLLLNRYTTIIWNCVPGDWKDADGWVEQGLAQVDAQDWSVVVLHDIQGACLGRLPVFLDALRERGVTFTQEFPDEVVLTRDGRPVSLRTGLVADAGAAR